MKDINKLIKYLNKRIEMHHVQANKLEKEEKKEDQIFNEGIAEGIKFAIEQIEKTNKELTEKLNKLF